MSEAVALGLTEDELGPPERLHPLYLLTGLGQSLRGAWGILAGGAYLAANGYWWGLIVMTVLFAFFSIGALYLRWLKLEYRVGAHEIRIDSGFLSRTSRAIPFDRVTDVDLEQGPLQRLFGLARVKLETGGVGGRQGRGRSPSHHRAGPGRGAARAYPRTARAGAGSRCHRAGGRRSGIIRHGHAPGTNGRPVQFLAGRDRRPVRRHPNDGRCAGLRPVRAAILDRSAGTVGAAAGAGHSAPDRRGGRGFASANPARRRHGPGPHHLARAWLPSRPDRNRLAPPPRLADPDRRHHSRQAGAGRDPRQWPRAAALRLVGAEATKPRPGRRQGRPCGGAAGS